MKRIIFDTDIGFDCDDAGALGLLHKLCDLQEAELLAVTACYDSPYVAGCIDAINRHYGRPVPVGVLYGAKKDVDDVPIYSPTLCTQYPNQFGIDNHRKAENAITLLRKVLSSAAEKSITLVITGSLSTADALLKSSPDSISTLSGKELIEKKIDRTVIMGGRFFESWPEDIILDGEFPVTWEWNMKADITAAQNVCDQWPGELVFSSYEIGYKCISMEPFCRLVPTGNPVSHAYRLHGSSAGRSSWDQTAILEAVRPGMYYKSCGSGRICVDNEGITHWHPDRSGTQTYLLPNYPPNTVASIIDSLILSDVLV